MVITKKEIINDFVVVLGSGLSINNLTHETKELINNCPVKISINKYAAFYEKAKITPTHVYFLDDFSKSAMLFLKYIINFLNNKDLNDITFIVSKNYRGCFKKTKIKYYISKAFAIVNLFIYKVILFVLRKFVKSFSVKKFNFLKNIINIFLKPKDVIRFNVICKTFKFEYISVQNWISKGNKWETSLIKPLYHYRGSLTTVLNYISIKFPNKKILFVGVDLNSPEYFFQEELNSLNIDSTDWTSEYIQAEKKHFSIINYKNTKIDDEFPFIIKSLKETGNIIYSISKNTYLVNQGFIKSIELNNN